MGQEPLKVRFYTGVLPGVRADDVDTHVRLLASYVATRAGHPHLEVQTRTAETAQQLSQFAEDARRGAVHVGVMWGLEYGWLSKQFPRLQLEPLVVASRGEGPWEIQVMVRQDSEAQTFGDLKGGRLAVYPFTPLPDRAYLAKLTKPLAPREYFTKGPPEYASVRDALFSVQESDADCVLVDTVTYSRFVALYDRRLRPVASTEFPAPVVLGKRELVEGIESGLWADLQRSFLETGMRGDGRSHLRFFKVDGFALPPRRFRELVERQTDEYPISLIEGVSSERLR